MFSAEDQFKLFQPGTILYFKNPNRLRNTTEPHYHIIIETDNDSLMVVAVTTTKIEKRIKNLEYNNHPHSTLVFLSPQKDNGLTKDCLVDCNNSCWFETKEDFKAIYNFNSGEIKSKGVVSLGKLEEIKQGILDSKLTTGTLKKFITEK